MKNKLNKTICLTLALIIIMTTPLGSYLQGENAKVYANAMIIDNNLAKNMLIPLLISAGLTFRTNQAAEETYYKLEDWLYDEGLDFELEPEDPNNNKPQVTVLNAISSMMAGKIIYDINTGGYKKIIEVKDSLFNYIKSWVDDNFNEGEHTEIKGLVLLNSLTSTSDFLVTSSSSVRILDENMEILYYLEYNSSLNAYAHGYSLGGLDTNIYHVFNYPLHAKFDTYFNHLMFKNKDGYGSLPDSLLTHTLYLLPSDIIVNESTNIYGIPNIVDNPNYDWNNPYTESKIITLPIETGIDTQPEVDSEGYHIPSVDTDFWVDKQPQEITEVDPSGVPQIDIPEVIPGEENEKELTFLQKILQQISGIRNNTETIKENSNKISENIESSSGGNDGIDIPTGFEWGDFKNFFEIFYIFIYFIAILILILVKLLSLVFVSLTNISPNTELFDSYPTILAGVNYIKNLQVGGLSITVHQAFEYVFTVFFIIFIIKQIRKLYDSFVYEEHERIRSDSGIKSIPGNENNDVYSNYNKNINYKDYRRK